ncbi:hypothetical protein [Dyadobacter sp. CY323]|uniref:hypothetical protein n=1 Tax=Dyadobacter sp. CY323 TaxID=2907302 RepID=UPI001F2F3ACC|nr:hypothetical protein [Dyadobacter sp. CY323]MCE6988456.1 hypothetical protein [Dyadobacter sp. CY323]
MKTSLIFTFFLAASLVLSGCGNKQEETETEEEASEKSPADALQAFADKAKEMGNREAVDPVDFRKLKEILPEELSGLKRTESTGEKSGAMGFTVSTAEGKYRGNSDESIDVEIIDTGGIAGVSTMALAAWSMADIDKETTTGYEKTTKIDGYKAFEKYNNESKSGEINVLVGDRYLVNIEGNNVSIDQIKGILKEIDLSELAALK